MKNVIQGTILSGTGAVSIAPGAEITIRNPAGQLVPLWADRAGTQPHDNPFLTDNEGNFRVYADSGWVHIRAQKNGSVREWRYVPIGSAAAMNIGEVYEALGSEIYSSVSEGLSNSAEGDYFLVESSGSLDLYRVVNGVAEQREQGIDADAILATRAYADGVAAEAESNATNAAVAAASSAYQLATQYSDNELQTHRESGDHDFRYYTKAEVDQSLSTKVDDDDPRLSDAREWTAEVVSQAEAEAGTSSVPRKWTAERVRQAIEALGGGGIDPGDLGTAATRDVTTSPTDTTEGRVLKVGDFGVGQAITIQLGTDLNEYIFPGEYHQPTNAYADPELNYPAQLAGCLKVLRTTTNGVVQEYTTYGSTRRKFLRGMHNGAWSSWVEFYHTGNLADAFNGANQSLSSNGYQKLPGGLIIQWGVANLGSNLEGPYGGASVIGTITFPIAFPTRPFSASVAGFVPGSTGNEATENFVSVQDISSSNLIVAATRVAGSGAANEILSVAWIAIGH